ncbi:TIR domain-containing protein [Neoroseomonas soli]|uniref:TIR domain-containing protein n=1 Tax=Neoroseomonas soli TaxID=1081025 RepID=A0A9X9WX93_9PROT|nr:TIR domain-containing protein [Neoroseomonas soli]MBR0671772.1 TIR domain-containing protein [Neoroseomonas soli]
MADVFISYNSRRRNIAEQLVRVLELNGYSVWHDRQLMAGAGFSQEIERELRAARAVVVVWCNLAVTSEWVREEASLAKRLRTMIPVRLERAEVPLGFGTLQSIDLSGWDGAPRSHLLDPLLLEVARLVGRDPVPQVRELMEFDKAWRRAGGSSSTPSAGGGDAGPASAPHLGASAAAVAAETAADDPRAVSTARPAPAAADAPAMPAATPLAPPDRPSIAVLPFDNLSDDQGKGYFADGIVEGIITGLSRKRWLLVIARNSTFTYRGRAVDVKQIGRELGVRYVLEGSVQISAGRLRISVQLVDTTTGAHIWAERYDRTIEDVFELQDEVSGAVVGMLSPQLERAEMTRARRKPTESLDAYDYYLRGVEFARQWTRESFTEALRLLIQATEIDPGYAAAYGAAAITYDQLDSNGWLTDRAAGAAEALRLARRAVELGKDDALALCHAAHAIARFSDSDAGAELIEVALALDPNLVQVWLTGGLIKVWQGEPEVAIQRFARAMRLSPVDPRTFVFQGGTAAAHFIAGRLDEARLWAARALRNQPAYGLALRVAAAANAMCGRAEEAQAALEALRSQDPGLRVSNLRERAPWDRESLALLAEGLRKAGLPD